MDEYDIWVRHADNPAKRLDEVIKYFKDEYAKESIVLSDERALELTDLTRRACNDFVNRSGKLEDFPEHERSQINNNLLELKEEQNAGGVDAYNAFKNDKHKLKVLSDFYKAFTDSVTTYRTLRDQLLDAFSDPVLDKNDLLVGYKPASANSSDELANRLLESEDPEDKKMLDSPGSLSFDLVKFGDALNKKYGSRFNKQRRVISYNAQEILAKLPNYPDISFEDFVRVYDEIEQRMIDEKETGIKKVNYDISEDSDKPDDNSSMDIIGR